jgi:Ca-activated chloride channel family protein
LITSLSLSSHRFVTILWFIPDHEQQEFQFHDGRRTMAKQKHGEKSVWHGLLDPGNVLLLLYIGVMLGILLFGNICSAKVDGLDNRTISESPRQGELFLATTNGTMRMAPQLNLQVAIQISGMVARVNVQQQFFNDTDAWVEAVYVFPLPDESSVDGLQMRVGERVIAGRIMEKQQAASTHLQAKAAGKKSTLLSQQRPNIFTTMVANIAPRENIAVELTYQQLVDYQDGTFCLRFPMVVGPRYIPGQPVTKPENAAVRLHQTGWSVDTDQVSDASAITPPVDLVDGVDMPVHLEVDLAAGFPLQEARSLYHLTTQEHLSDDHWRLNLAGAIMADRDFVLQWLPKVTEPRAALFAENLGDSQYLLLMLVPPLDYQALNVPREIVFILDISGSMAGTSIEQAKSALLMALDRLRPHDRFNIIAFNDAVRSFQTQAQPANDNTLGRARQFVQDLKADGGTEMKPALLQALDGAHHHEYLRQVVFLTDGAVGNEEELFQIINKRVGDSRLFPVGIGSAPNSYFMSRAAAIGRGTFTYIGSLAEVAGEITRLLEKIAAPVLTDLKLNLDTADTKVEIFPERLPDLYRGEPLIATIRTRWLNNTLTLAGRLNGREWQTTIDTRTYGERQGIAKLWARKKMRSRMESMVLGADPQQVRETVLATALEYQLVSQYTSLVAVDTEASRPVDRDISQRPVVVKLPQGWQADAVFGGRPQTATPAQLRMLIGSFLLLSALFVYLRRSLCLAWKRR